MTSAELQALLDPLWAKRPDLHDEAHLDAMFEPALRALEHEVWMWTGWFVSRLPNRCMVGNSDTGGSTVVDGRNEMCYDGGCPLAALVAFFISQEPPNA